MNPEKWPQDILLMLDTKFPSKQIRYALTKFLFEGGFPSYMIPSYFLFQWDNIKTPQIRNLIVKDVAALGRKFKSEADELKRIFQGMSVKPVRKLRYSIGANLPPGVVSGIAVNRSSMPLFDTTDDVEMVPRRKPVIRLAQALIPRAVLNEDTTHEAPEVDTGPSKYAKNFQPFAGGTIGLRRVEVPLNLRPTPTNVLETPIWTPSAFEIPTQTSSDYSIVYDDEASLPNPEPKRMKGDEGEILIAPDVIIGSGMYKLKRPMSALEDYRKRVARMPELERYFATAGLRDRHSAENDIIQAVYAARESMNPHFIDMALDAAKQVRKFAGDEFGMMVADQIPAIKAQKRYVENVRKHNEAIADVVSDRTGVSVPHIADMISSYAPYENRVVELD